MFPTKSSLVLVLLVILTLRTKLSGANNFTLGTDGEPFKCNPKGNVFCGGDANSAPGYLALSPVYDPKIDFYVNTSGTVLTDVPLLLFNSLTNRWDSFTTSFEFKIEPSPDGPGDGMTFAMLNVSQYPGDSGGSFGLYDSSGQAVVATLAIEFDTYLNEGDINSNHVGLDLENLTSITARDASAVGITLAGNASVYCWIDYDSSSDTMQVRISLTNSRPVDAFLQFNVNLSDIFHQTPQVYLGFTAANGACICHSFYSVYNWKFEHFPVHLSSPPSSPPSPPNIALIGPSPLSPSLSPFGSKGRHQTLIIAGATIGSTVLLVSLGLVLFLCRKRRSGADLPPKLGRPAELASISNSLRYSYKQLSVATDQFREDSKLGQGGFGSVYRGVIPSSGESVAVKKVSNDSKQGLREFVAEVTIISQLRHRNIVRLLGWCSDDNKFLLVYEFMPNGSLDKVLFKPAPGFVLAWKYRFQIIVGAAEALHYLHEGWRQQIIHRDFKSSNIMLDEDFNAMLGDFGLARMISHHEDPATTVVAGTFGYIAPEVPTSGKFTEKTDVYAFGAVALEVVCGRIAYNSQLPEAERVLVDWVWTKLEEGDLMTVVDPSLGGQYDAHWIQVVLLLGLACSHPNPDDRPSMRQVLEVLSGDIAMPPVPLSKPAPQYHYNGPQFCLTALHLLSTTDTITGLETESAGKQKPADGSDPLIVFSNTSVDSQIQGIQ